VNRTGQRPALLPAEVELVTADVSDRQQAIAAARGAGVVYQALNPPYHQWPQYFPALQKGAMAAAEAAGAVYVSIENLYMYDSAQPITEKSPLRPKSKKGELRAKMADEVQLAHQRGQIQATTLRSSDYYGPGVLGSALGEMVFGRLAAGKKAQLTGSAVMPHSLAYIKDVGQAAVRLGSNEKALGQVWIAPHAPALTQGQVVEIASQFLGQKTQFSVVSPLMMRLAGLFVPEAHATVEMMYEFIAPFVVDSTQFEQIFQMKATPAVEGINQTMAWYTGRDK
jgi:nucleoside-diphosphate-sugar epimerase